MQGCAVRAARASRPYEHPERSASYGGGERISAGCFEMHPSFGMDGRASVLDLDLALMQRLDTQRALSGIAPFSDQRVRSIGGCKCSRAGRGNPAPAAQAAGSDLVDIEFVRQYTGVPLPEDRKSISYRLTVGASDRTLSSEEVTAIRNRVIEALQRDGFELRI